MNVCNAQGQMSGGTLLVPGHPESSLISQRIAATDAELRMPPLGSVVVDTTGSALVDGWIGSVASCP
jgi:hypothetical protein